MKFLVVDDEVVSRAKLKNIFDQFGECLAVDSGPAALEAFKQALADKQPFDLIALDFNMPEMDGAMVLDEIRKEEQNREIEQKKHTKVMMVTASSDRDSLHSCVMMGCDDYVIKPYDRETVIRKVGKLISLPDGETRHTPRPVPVQARNETKNAKVDIARELIARFESGELDLPTPSPLYARFRQLSDREASILEISELLRNDVGISVSLIGVANSPYYRGVNEIQTLEQAINRLGLEITKKYVNLICNREIYQTRDKRYLEYMDRLWKHSLGHGQCRHDHCRSARFEADRRTVHHGIAPRCREAGLDQGHQRAGDQGRNRQN